MWRNKGVENPLNAFVGKSTGNVDGLSFFNTRELFHRTEKISNIVSPNHARISSTRGKPLFFHYTRISVHDWDYFCMDSTRIQLIEEQSPFLLGSSTNDDVKWIKVVDSCVVRRRRLNLSLSTGKSAMAGRIVENWSILHVTQPALFEFSEDISLRIA